MSALRSPRILSARLTQLSYLPRRNLSITPFLSAWKTGPAPPRLPKDEQERFEKLQQQSTGAFSQPRTPDPTPTTVQPSRPQINQSPQTKDEGVKATVNASGKGEELHPNIRRGAPPEFDGETNPKTGEVGGPKNEPLRWGHGGDWSYNGRVTDF